MWQYLAITGLCLVAVATAQTEPPQEFHRHNYPNPTTDLYKCGRFGRASHVCDPNSIITQEEANQLDNLIDLVTEQTRCPCSREACKGPNNRGYQIGVALMKKIADDDDDDDDDTGSKKDIQAQINNNLQKAQLFAYYLEQTWRLGQCEEDVVIVYSQDDNVLYTMTGKVAKLKLRSTYIGDISLSARAQFGPSTFEGLKQMINDFRDAFEDNYSKSGQAAPRTAALKDKDSSGATATSVMLAVLLSCLLAAIMN